jgi:hypothetical protein
MRLPYTNFSLNVGSFAVGAATVIAVPIVLPVVGSALKAIAKTGFKAGMIAYNKSKELAFDSTETISSVTKEAISEAESEIKASRPKTKKASN